MMEYSNYQDSYTEYLKSIPSHWRLKKLKYSAKSPKESIAVSEFEEDVVVHYSIPNIQEFGKGQLEDGKEIDSAKIKLSGGEVLISKLNPRKATICIVEQHNELVVGSGEFIPFIPRDCNNKFLYYFFNSSRFTDYLNSCVESVTRSHQRIKPELIYNSFIGLPLQNEQQAIVSFLDNKTEKIDKLIQLKERKIELLKEKRTALINDLVTGKRVWDGKEWVKPTEIKDSGVEWIGEIPSQWTTQRMKFFVDMIKSKDVAQGSDVRISPENVISGTGECINKYSEHGGEGFKFKEGDVLLNKLRIYLMKIYLAKEEGFSMGEMIVLRTRDFGRNEFLYFVLFHQGLIDFWNAQSSGVKMPRVSPEIILDTHIPLPPNAEIERVVTYLNYRVKKTQSIIKKHKKIIELLKEYRQTLISEVVTGKIRVVDQDLSMTSQPQMN